MSSIHYKFRSTIDYKTLSFEGLHISVEDFKKAICEKENIRIESFDLKLTNAHTNRSYGLNELVPRNSSVIVQRTPHTTTSGVATRNPTVQEVIPGFIQSAEFSKMSEEERLAHVMEVSNQKYNPSNYQKKSTGIMTGPPPPTYTCNRCSNPGHWYKNCPLLNTRRATGIPMEELMETTQDNPLAMIHSSGKFVVPIMHHNARMNKKPDDIIAGLLKTELQKTEPPQQVKVEIEQKPVVSSPPPPIATTTPLAATLSTTTTTIIPEASLPQQTTPIPQIPIEIKQNVVQQTTTTIIQPIPETSNSSLFINFTPNDPVKISIIYYFYRLRQIQYIKSHHHQEFQNMEKRKRPFLDIRSIIDRDDEKVEKRSRRSSKERSSRKDSPSRKKYREHHHDSHKESSKEKVKSVIDKVEDKVEKRSHPSSKERTSRKDSPSTKIIQSTIDKEKNDNKVEKSSHRSSKERSSKKDSPSPSTNIIQSTLDKDKDDEKVEKRSQRSSKERSSRKDSPSTKKHREHHHHDSHKESSKEKVKSIDDKDEDKVEKRSRRSSKERSSRKDSPSSTKKHREHHHNHDSHKDSSTSKEKGKKKLKKEHKVKKHKKSKKKQKKEKNKSKEN